MKNIFTEHPKSLGETYFQHMKFACWLGWSMLMASVAFIIHAIFPFLLQKTGSNILFKVTHRFIDRVPKVEERLIHLSEALDHKIKHNSVIY